MIVSVDARPGAVRAVLTERGIVPIECEWDDAACVTELQVPDGSGPVVLRDIVNAGMRWWRGRPRAEHRDPTYAQAAQRILRREAGR